MKCVGKNCNFEGNAQEWLTLFYTNQIQIWAEANKIQKTMKEITGLYACPKCGNVQIFR